MITPKISGTSGTDRFTDTGQFGICKQGNTVNGDTVSFRRTSEMGRIVAVLADGLGSGIKAGVLSILTATMAGLFVSRDIDIRKAARVITGTLPVCSVRRIGYSTFTIIDIDAGGTTHVMEFDNPECLLFSRESYRPLPRVTAEAESADGSPLRLFYSSFTMDAGDRLVFMSDGVTQSGLGNAEFPLGWGTDSVISFVSRVLAKDPSLSAHGLAKRLVRRACANDRQKPGDDITAGVIYVRKPKRVLLVTGPPFDPDKDMELHRIVSSFDGSKIVCGGTTAKIIAREAGTELRPDIHDTYPGVPPGSILEGFDLATEGTVTLAHLERLLADGVPEGRRRDKAVRLREILLDHDIIRFVVGTRVNQAHQDPSLSTELDIRRNTVRRISDLLEKNYFKETTVSYL